MPTKKEALLKAGLIPAVTRGRISDLNHKWLKANPDKWDDAKALPKTLTVPKAVASAPKPEPVGHDYGNPFTYPESEYKALDKDGKEHSMRWVCKTCRVSLVAHACLSPVIVGDIAVKIVPR